MTPITMTQFKDPTFRYREWYQGCGDKAEYGLLNVLEMTKEWIAEPKRDGIWAIAFFDETGVQFYSRTQELKPYSLDRIVIPGLFGCALVGELGFGSQESIRRRMEYGKDFMDVYDVVVKDLCVITDYTDGQRRELLDNLYHRTSSHPDRHHFIWSPRYETNFVKHYEEQPEGLILKPRTGFPYTPGRKVKHWMKAKKDHTVDMVIMGWVESDAETKRGKGMVEFIRCGMYVNGELKELVHVGSMTHELSKDIYANWPKYEMKVVELKHFGQFRSGALRHPSVFRMRPDKRAEDCIFDPEVLSHANFKSL